ncbi:hypothetical protein RZS28_05130 [Methylocapsa polymorpha]|uniref:Uncharacterized protein n=1 Tax=Methylocapsa polymorpha TaxID=3080828 RepID=A0ABZ0HV63_9HYPH|nr:hypothetical protein RZS28_05130 [Methylocapsa sp. RX1]
MFEMVKTSALLFFQGKLFQNQAEALRQLAIGIGLTVIVFLIVAKLANIVLAGVVAGFIGGAAQPALFKNLKFR